MWWVSACYIRESHCHHEGECFILVLVSSPVKTRRGGGRVPIFDCLFISGVMLTGREDVMARREERGVVVVEGELISHVTTQ